MSFIESTQTIKTEVCDVCGKPEGLTKYRRFNRFFYIVCYGWRRERNGNNRTMVAHYGCLADVLEEYLRAKS